MPGQATPQITIVGSTSPGTGSPWKVAPQWDSINIGGTVYGWQYQSSNTALEGSKVRIVGAKRKYKIEVKLPQGADGGILTYRGVKLTPFDIEFWIINDAQYSYFVTNMLPTLKFSGLKQSPNPATVQSLAVYHPILSNLDINAILVEEIGGVDPKEDGPGEFICKVRVIEYLPPPDQNTTVTPAGTQAANQPTSVGVQTPTAISQRQSAINNQILVANSFGGLGP